MTRRAGVSACLDPSRGRRAIVPVVRAGVESGVMADRRPSARSIDTTREAEQVQLELLRGASPAARLGVAVSLTQTVIGAARRALARTSPQASQRHLDVRFVALHYGRELAERLEQELARRDADSRAGG